MEETTKKKSGIEPESVEKIRSLAEEFANEYLKHIVVSNPVNREGVQKVRIRPVLLKGELTMQAEELIGTQAFHKNLKPEELAEYLIGLFSGVLKQAQVSSALGEATVLVSKSGTVTVRSAERMAQSRHMHRFSRTHQAMQTCQNRGIL